MAVKGIGCTSPLSEQGALFVPLTPIFTKSSAQLLMGHTGILPCSLGGLGEDSCLELFRKLHKAMLLHLAHSPTRDLGKGEALMAGGADITVTSLSLLPL